MWSETLRRAVSEGPLLACPVVFAEMSIGFATEEACTEALHSLGIEYSDFEQRSAWIAGQILAQYRREGGPRGHLIPDFLVAAHAVAQADRLAAIDRGYLRRYFVELEVLVP